MAEILVLGTAASVPDARHDTIALLLRGPGWAVLVECGGSPVYRLAGAGIALGELHALILTHGHSDHLYGLPMVALALRQAGRQTELPIYGPAQALERGRKLLDLLGLLRDSERFTPVWQPVPLYERQPVLEIGGVRISASPGVHRQQDTLALRFENTVTGHSIVYSSDTEPCPAVARLAAAADTLIHEATGARPGHSSPEQAAQVARQSGAEHLVLIHYPVHDNNLDEWRDRAAAVFPGSVTLAEDGDIYSF